MIDSWMPRKLEPGLAATYSRLSALRTSTMKSPPGRSVVTMSTSGDGSASLGAIGALAGAAAAGTAVAVCASAAAALPTKAAPVTAALFRKSRRSTEAFFFIVAVAYNPQRFMAIRQLALHGLLAFAIATGASAQGNRPVQTPDEFRRMLAMGTKYRTALEFYAALKAAAPGAGRQMPA